MTVHRFDGKVVIITGGGGGYGSAFAERFASEGASVAVVDIRLEAAQETAGKLESAIAIESDVTSMSSTAAMAATVLETFGRIDVLVNNAGGARAKNAMFWEMEDADWDRIVDLNLKSQWLCARAVFPAMRDQGGGKIVNMASGSALGGKPAARCHYIAAKAGVQGLTRAMATECGAYNIQVNCVFPGYMPFPTHGEPQEVLLQRHRELYGPGLLTKPRSTGPVAGTIAFLASADSDSMTGQTLNTDGGTLFL
jgi:NAD(P)-dependent dehydrogenase (short-subunit alcohol dehydrogenase family)